MATQPIINQPWEDVADDVTGAIEKAVQPLLRKAVDEIYSGLLDATQDYLKDNLALNIASRIDAAERQADHDRQENARLREALIGACDLIESAERETSWVSGDPYGESAAVELRALASSTPL